MPIKIANSAWLVFRSLFLPSTVLESEAGKRIQKNLLQFDQMVHLLQTKKLNWN